MKAKFQGVNAKVLDRIAATLAKTVTTEDQVASAVEGVSQAMIEAMEAYGDSRATEATQSAVQNYETKYGIKDGVKVTTGGASQQPETQQPAAGGAGEQTPPWAQALIDSNKQLVERVNRMEAEKTTSSRKVQLDGLLTKLPENLRKGYERITLDGLKDEEFNSLISEVTTEVNNITADLNSRGAVFGRPSAHNGGQQTGELTKEQQDAIAQRNGSSKDGEQPF